jgi:hypothetical protein
MILRLFKNLYKIGLVASEEHATITEVCFFDLKKNTPRSHVWSLCLHRGDI